LTKTPTCAIRRVTLMPSLGQAHAAWAIALWWERGSTTEPEAADNFGVSS